MLKILTSAAVASLLAAATVPLGAQGRSTIIERVLVRVNGEILTQSQLTQRQGDAIRQRNPESQRLTDAAVAKLAAEVTPDVLVDTIDEMLLSQHGRELGGALTEAEFADGIEQIKKDNKLDDAQFKEALKQEGLTMEELRANFERAKLVQVVQRQEVLRRMNITDEELRQYYQGHREEFMQPEMVTLRELAVVPAPGREDARARIESIRARAIAGQDFDGLVKEFSDGPTKSTGGLIGPVNVADINPVLKDLIAGLKPGEVSPVVEAQAGRFQIFKLEERQAAGLPPFDQVRDRVEQAIRGERLRQEMTRIVARLRTQAVIEWKDEALRQIYHKRVAERQAAGAPPLASAR